MIALGWNYDVAIPVAIGLLLFMGAVALAPWPPRGPLLLMGDAIWLASSIATLALIDLPMQELHRSIGYAVGVAGVAALPFVASAFVFAAAPGFSIPAVARKLVAFAVATLLIAALPPALFAGAIYGCALSGAPSCL
jgi:hypothetical protein